MPIEIRRAYLDTIRERYKNAPKKQKTAILSEFVINCGYSRKYAIRILNGRLQPRINKSGPKPIYSQVEPHWSCPQLDRTLSLMIEGVHYAISSQCRWEAHRSLKGRCSMSFVPGLPLPI